MLNVPGKSRGLHCPVEELPGFQRTALDPARCSEHHYDEREGLALACLAPDLERAPCVAGGRHEAVEEEVGAGEMGERIQPPGRK